LFQKKRTFLLPALTYLSLRVPAVQITANLTSTVGTSSNSKSKSHAGAIAGGVVGGIAALLAIGAMLFVAWRRRRQSHKRASVGSSLLSFTLKGVTDYEDTQVNLTPLGPSESGFTTAVALPQTDWQPDRFVRRQSVSEASPFLSSPTVPVPVGLSDKELAQLRLGGMRSSPGMDGRPSVATLSPTATSEGGTTGGAATASEVTTSSRSEALRLRTEVDFLMQEVQQLRAERSPEAPPTYVSGVDGDT